MVFWAAFLGSTAVDYVSKVWVRSTIPLGESRPVIHGLLEFMHWRNPGAAFGTLRNANLYLAIVSAVCVLAAVFLYPKFRTLGPAFAVSLGLVSGGALGNLLDRVQFGSVTDFLSVSFFPPIFNVADSAIVVGAIIMVGLFLFSLRGSI